VLTIPAVALVAAGMVATTPVWAPIALVIDVVRGAPRVALRCGLFLTWFAACELAGLLGAGASIGVARLWPQGSERGLYALQRAWSGALFAGARRIFGFRLEVDGAEHAAGTPLLLFLRHASMADTLLPAVLVANVFGTRLRYVIKRELLIDPCLDVVGHRLPNYFVDRFSEEGSREAAAIGALAADLGKGDGVLIYPEGTRYTPEKRERIIARLAAAGDAEGAARAAALHHVLPPRSGGPLALLEAAPQADVVFCAHAGFEAAATFPSLWRGDLVGRTIRVRFWRVPRSEIPGGGAERRAWLYGQWRRIDEWLDEVAAAGAST
jgi:1-acyl-sn-glycerol-3-phosphate acyltransferase